MDSKWMSDGELARSCKHGDPNAWKNLISRFSPLVYRLSIRMLSSQDEAEDACQEVFLRIYRSFHSYDPTRPLAPWVSRIAYNACLRRLGKSSRKRNQPIDPQELELLGKDEHPGPERIAADKEASSLLLAALDRLSVQDRVLLDLRYREGLSEAEVAEATEIPVNTVKTRLHRARGRLKQLLGRVLRGGQV